MEGEATFLMALYDVCRTRNAIIEDMGDTPCDINVVAAALVNMTESQEARLLCIAACSIIALEDFYAERQDVSASS